jgi:hypothetical protein
MNDTQGPAKAVPNIDAQKIVEEASWLGARLREPSTYAGLGVLLTLVFHVSNAGALALNIETIGVGLGSIILAVIAIVVPERASAAPRPAMPNISSAAMWALCVIGASLIALPALAAPAKLKLPIPLPALKPALAAPAAPAAPAADYLGNFMNQLEQIKAETVAAVIADIQAADADAGTMVTPAIPANPGSPAIAATATSPAVPAVPATPAVPAAVRDPIAHACYPALVKFLQSTPTFAPATGKLVGFQLFQRKRDFVAQLKAGIPTYLQLGCAPLLGDEANTFIQAMGMVGVKIAPAAIAAICPPCAAAAAPIALPALTLTP